MSLPLQIAAYGDCFEVFERAKANPRGVRVHMGPKNSAERMRYRMQMARRLARDESRRMYDRTAPQWNKSEFDDLILLLRQDEDGEWWVYVERYGMDIGVIEPLSDEASP